jgi:hypothetical protein
MTVTDRDGAGDTLAEAVRGVCWSATPYGQTPEGDIAAYIVPKGAMHRLVGAAQSAGIPASFRVLDNPAAQIAMIEHIFGRHSPDCAEHEALRQP